MTIRRLEYKDMDAFFLKSEHPMKIKINIGLSDNQKNAIYRVLKELYADTFLLMVKTLDYHWNIKGNLLFQMRNLTFDQYQELFSTLSELAKRMKILGFESPTSLYQVMNNTSLVEKNSKASPIALIADLISDNENISKQIREKLTVVHGARDETTLNILRKRLEIHEDNAWELRCLIEK
jgi:starvation-inducible DNA-binding protein